MTAAALSEEDEEGRSGADKNTQAGFSFLFLCVRGSRRSAATVRLNGVDI